MNISRTLTRLISGYILASASIAAGATVTVPDNGDIFLGVRASGGQGSGVSLLINVGDDTTFRNATAGSTVALANVGVELSTAFGANWSTRNDLSWAFFGARNQTNPVTYGTRTQFPVGLPAPSFPAQDLSQRTATKNQIISVVDAYSLLNPFNGNANAALQTNGLNSGSYSFQVGSAGTSDFGSLSQWVSIEGDFGAGASGTVLDFFRYADSTTVPATERLGSFEISSAGALSFTRSLAPGVAGIKLAQSTFSGDEDAGTVTLTFRRTDDVSAAVSATFSTSNGSATSGTDYTAQTNVAVNFAIGEFEKTVTIPITDRAGIAPSREFTVILASPSSGAELVSPSSATITINDTDSEVQFVAATAQVRALDVLSQPATVELSVNRSGDLSDPASVSVSITGGTLNGGSNFTFTSPTPVSFIAGDSAETVSIPLNAIPLNALPGTIVVTLSNPTGTSLGTIASSTVTVLPNSGEISFADASPSVNAVNGNGLPNLVTVNLARANGTSGPATVTVSVTGGTLTSGVHFVPLANPTNVTFANGSDTASFTIQLNAITATLLNSGATIQLGLSNPTNSATLGATSSSTLTVFGTPGSISILAGSFNVLEEVGTFNLPLVRTGGTSGAVSVSVTTTNGTGPTGATAPTDFTALNGFVANFADGVSTVLVPITIFNTVPNEPNETFTVTISNATGGAATGATTTSTLRILDVDTAPPALTLTAPAANAKLPATPTTVNIVGSARDNREVARIELQFNGAAFVNVPFTVDSRGAANFTFPVTPQRGTNIVVLRSLDHRGNVSPLAIRTFIFDDPFVALAGSYSGLSIADEDTVLSHSSVGLVNIQVVSAGTFTGRLTVDGLALPFSGFIGNGGIARFGSTGLDKIRVERPNKPGFEIAFVLDVSAGAGTKRITGTVKEFRRRALVGTSEFTAERKIGVVPDGYLANKGAYTVVFPVTDQDPFLDEQDYPQGDGVGIATVKADGSVSIAATLADGTSFTASSLLWSNLRLPFYTELYAKAGSLSGVIILDDTQADSDFKGEELYWFRPFQNVQHYPDGWPEGLDTVIVGAKYVVSATASSLPGPLAPANPTTGNAELGFTGGLLTSDVIKAVNIDNKDKATNAPATDRSFTLSIAQATGLFTGRFTHTDTTQPAFTGVIYQKGPNKGGYGYFLSTSPRVRDGTGQAGAVTLTKK